MAEFGLPTPTPMRCTGNLEENWKTFKEDYEDYAAATELSKKDAKTQAGRLKVLMGTPCKSKLKGLKLSAEKMADPKEIIAALDAEFIKTKHNVLFDRYQFYMAVQQQHESVEQFVDRLRQLAANCKFDKEDS